MSVLTQVQTVAQRLTEEHVMRTPLITWPFLPKVQEPLMKLPEAASKTSVRSPPATAAKRRENLLRSSSFVKLRQFCNQSCDALSFLRARRSALQSTLNHGLLQVKAFVLVLAVYLAVCALALQLGACLYLLAGKPAPPGLVFMVVSLFAIMGTFSQIIVSFTLRRQPKRAIHLSRKKKNN